MDSAFLNLSVIVNPSNAAHRKNGCAEREELHLQVMDHLLGDLNLQLVSPSTWLRPLLLGKWFKLISFMKHVLLIQASVCVQAGI